ncbi:hypothetical protein FRC07_006042 [Ceratobasidium sp. 392]|nr:hypothetical protein FRC07_006042 [Ceratobasidium sp. 392]
MRFLSTAFFTAVALSVSALGAKHLPGYTHLYSWTAELSDVKQIEGPLGTRIGVSILGYPPLPISGARILIGLPTRGNLTAPNGKLLAKAVTGLGGDTGVIDKTGNVQIDARVFYQFIDDGKYAYVVSTGVGSFTGCSFDAARIETDSPARSAWNSYFIVANVSLPTPTLLKGDAFTFSSTA